MSTIAALDGAGQGRSAPVNQFSEMKTEDFIDIIFTELTNQDPLEPNDSSALLEQLNSIRSIESDVALTDKLQSLVTENQLAAASNMIGKYIAGMNEESNRVQGYVVSAAREGDTIKLELDNGWTVPIGSVESIVDPQQFAQQPGQNGSGGGTSNERQLPG